MYGTALLGLFITYRAQWLRSRASHPRLREPGFESCAAGLNLEQVLFSLHWSSSLSCKKKYRAINSGGYFVSSLRAILVA